MPPSLFNLERAGHIYSRISNPTVAVLEERVARFGGRGRCRLPPPSGHAALFLGISHPDGAGWAYRRLPRPCMAAANNLFSHTLPRFGIETTKVRPARPGRPSARRSGRRPGWSSARRIGNPGLEVMDIAADWPKSPTTPALPLMVDSTFATPHLCRPIDHGADLVMHSADQVASAATVWRIGGILVDGGHLRLGGVRKVPDPHRALCRLSRIGFRRGVRASGAC
ncbi:MAG: PLP-dependent transferase [Thalassobaculum sp.]